MGHHHDHDHPHDHHHDHPGHPHDHHHGGDHPHHHPHAEAQSADRAKLRPLIEHWIRHNEDHAASFLQWAVRAEAAGEATAAALLREAARETDRQNDTLRQALEALGRAGAAPSEAR